MPKSAEDLFKEKGMREMGGEVEMWEPKAGDSLLGVLIEIRDIDTKKGPQKIYVFERAGDGVSVGVWGSHILNTRLSQKYIGQELGLSYGGLVAPEKGGNEYHKWSIFATPQAQKEPEPEAKFVDANTGEEMEEIPF